MKVVHWLRPEAGASGLLSYTYQLHFKSVQMGYDSHICFVDSRFKDGDKTARFEQSRVQEFKPSPWKVSDDAINVIHNQLIPFKLQNVVTELHGMPQYVCRDLEHMTSTAYLLGNSDLLLTRFPLHVQYWEQLTNKPIEVIPAGVDLDFWKLEGKAKQFHYHPTILWADSWREPVKDPWDLLYAMKIVSAGLPSAKLKMVNVPPEKRDILHYMVGRLGLDAVIDWPIEGQVANIDEYYRGCDMVYSPVDWQGDNVVWEALSCGCPVIYTQESPAHLATAIRNQTAYHQRVPCTSYDIRKTVREMMYIFERHFGNLQGST